MNKDIVIINSETRDVLGIITNSNLENSEVITTYGMEILEVDNTKQYIIGDETTGRIKYKNPESNIIYLDDYRQGGAK